MIVIDVETSGIDPKKNSIVSIGAIDFPNPKNSFYAECRIWNGSEINSEALKINGFSIMNITSPEKPSLEEIIRNLLMWTENIKDRTIAGINPFFDRDFLRESCKRCNIKYPFGDRIVDLHSLCYADYLRRGKEPLIMNGRTAIDSKRLFEYVGLPEEPRPHNAKTGAEMEAEAFSRIIYGENLLEPYAKYPIPYYLII